MRRILIATDGAPWSREAIHQFLETACIGEAEDDVITIDPHELQDAMWVSREDVRKSLAGDPSAPFLSPPHYAIAHTLLTVWAAEG